jgi:hypothetical protein
MRLSAIYALLDCSTTIEVEHHRAALALWNYCDRSARWIFQTATGDSRADRILLALRAAGRTSMTRTEISERVFNRNLPADSWTPRFGFCINRDMRRSTKKLPADLRVQDGLQSITLYKLNELTNTNVRTTTHILNLTCGLNCER